MSVFASGSRVRSRWRSTDSVSSWSAKRVRSRWRSTESFRIGCNERGLADARPVVGRHPTDCVLDVSALHIDHFPLFFSSPRGRPAARELKTTITTTPVGFMLASFDISQAAGGSNLQLDSSTMPCHRTRFFLLWQGASTPQLPYHWLVISLSC